MNIGIDRSFWTRWQAVLVMIVVAWSLIFCQGTPLAAAAKSLVDINTASKAELEAVKGVGLDTTNKIIASRPYKSLDEFSKIGLSAKKIESFKSSLTVGEAPAPTAPAASAEEKRSAQGKVKRGMLGVQVQKVTPELAITFGMSEPRGALVAEVNPGSPAEKAGIHRGDIVIEFNGHPIHEMKDLPQLVGNEPPGSNVTVKILREGKEMPLTVTMAELTEEHPATGQQKTGGEKDRLGLEVKNLDPNLAKEFGLRDTKGVVVVMTDAPAHMTGFRSGDLLVEIDGRVIESLKEYREVIGKLKKDSYARFLIKRKGGTFYLTMLVTN